MKAEPRFWPAVPGQVWDRIRSEFSMPTQEELDLHFETLFNDPAPFMQKAVRVFVGDETYCPGFQLRDGLLDQRVLDLFSKAMELKIPHNIFAAWMMTPSRRLDGSRPVDMLDRQAELGHVLEDFSRRRL